MVKNRYKTLLSVGVATVAVTQIATMVPAVAATGIGPMSPGQTVIDSRDIIEQMEKDKTDTGTRIVKHKGEKGVDYLNMEIHQEVDNDIGYQFLRYTKEDGTPFTGMYLDTVIGTGVKSEWLVLDKEGYFRRDVNKPQYAWKDGNLCADFLRVSGPNLNEADNQYYLCRRAEIEGARINIMVVNDWYNDYGNWYRSDSTGKCLKNQWFKDPKDGKWYYFGADMKMVTNKLVNGYWIGADGVWKQ